MFASRAGLGMRVFMQGKGRRGGPSPLSYVCCVSVVLGAWTCRDWLKYYAAHNKRTWKSISYLSFSMALAVLTIQREVQHLFGNSVRFALTIFGSVSIFDDIHHTLDDLLSHGLFDG